MAGYNRFARRNRFNQFNPVTLDEFITAPMAAQQVHNEALASALANRTDIKSLPWHEQERLRITNEMEGAINSLTDEISERGILDMPVQRRLTELSEKKRSLFGPGSRGEEIQTALANRSALKEQLAKSDNPVYWQNQQMAYFDAQSRQNSRENIYGYSTSALSDYQDINKLALEYGDELSASSIASNTGYRQTGDGRWENIYTSEKTNGTPERVTAYIRGFLGTNKELMSFLSDSAKIAQMNNPDLDMQEFVNEQLSNAATLAGGAKQFREVDQKIQSMNMSKAQLYGSYLNSALSRGPAFRDANQWSNPEASDSRIDALINPEKIIKSNIIDKDGNDLSIEEAKRRMISEGLNPKVAENLLNEMVNIGFLEGGISNWLQSGDWSGAGGNQSDYNDAKSFIARNYDVRSLTKEETNVLKEQGQTILTNLRNSYNQSVPEGQRISDNNEFAEVMRQQLKKEQNLWTQTVDYQIPANDLISSQLSDGHFSVLNNKNFTVYEDGKPVAMSTKEKQAWLGRMTKNKSKVSSGTRITYGEFVGGRHYTIGDPTSGKTYTINTQPLNDKEAAIFRLDEAIFNQMNNISLQGKGNYIGYEPFNNPELVKQGIVKQYAPVREWKNGQMSTSVSYRAVQLDMDENGNVRYENGAPKILRVIDEATPEEYFTIKQFTEQREEERADDYYDMYYTQQMFKEMNPRQ